MPQLHTRTDRVLQQRVRRGGVQGCVQFVELLYDEGRRRSRPAKGPSCQVGERRDRRRRRGRRGVIQSEHR